MTRLRALACTGAVLFGLLGARITAHAGELLDLRAVDPIAGDAAAGKAKATVCGACHGAAGVSAVPAFPHLAGQSADYLYWALVAFKRGARPQSPMVAQVATLDDADLRDLAAWFASLPPPSGVAAANVDARGARLFRDGDPQRGIPPCQGCHGRDAEGHPDVSVRSAYRTYPRLGAQHAAYVSQRLQDYRAGTPDLSSNDRIMRGVAATLDDASIAAIADWLQAGAP